MGYAHPLFFGQGCQFLCLVGWMWPPNFLFGMMDEATMFFVWLDGKHG
jgi:hypothetical protein